MVLPSMSAPFSAILEDVLAEHAVGEGDVIGVPARETAPRLEGLIGDETAVDELRRAAAAIAPAAPAGEAAVKRSVGSFTADDAGLGVAAGGADADRLAPVAQVAVPGIGEGPVSEQDHVAGCFTATGVDHGGFEMEALRPVCSSLQSRAWLWRTMVRELRLIARPGRSVGAQMDRVNRSQ